MEATPKNPDYWTINYEHPLADGAGEIRTNIAINRLFAFWGVGVVVEASRGLWTVSWDDDRTQELASGASSTKTRTQFGYPNFVQHPKTLQFQRCDFNV